MPLALLLAAVLLSGCGAQSHCELQKNEVFQPANAGCLVVRDEQVLLVSNHRGQWALPGGATERGESPMCTARRETSEETGLDVQPIELVEVFDNGFHVYRCEPLVPFYKLETRAPREIKEAQFFAATDFSELRWRYSRQGEWIAIWLQKALQQ